MHTFLKKALIIITVCSIVSLVPAQTSNIGKPNILVLYVDDMGYLPEFTGCKLMHTPHMDALAAGGMVFSDGYVSAPICAPSRVGLITGRYQARTGHDSNAKRPGCELLLTETTMAQRMKSLGYRTGMVGKWHLGMTDQRFFPLQRGFDYFIGHEGNVNEGADKYFRGNEKIGEIQDHPVTSPLWADEACAFLERNQNDPFFLYVAFNAVHAPHAARKETLAEFSEVKSKSLRNYMAMTREVDDATGKIMEKLGELKLAEKTLVFFISDNGKAFSHPDAYGDDGLRGRKWYVFEGGIRVPFVISWKGKISAGSTSSEPVIQLDVLPTAIAAAGGMVDPAWNLDGINLLPFVTGKQQKFDRTTLYWRFGAQYAIREGQWKLVKALAAQERPYLIDLSADIGEQNDLTEEHPELVIKLQRKWDTWNAQMQAPRWEDKRWFRTEEGPVKPENIKRDEQQ